MQDSSNTDLYRTLLQQRLNELDIPEQQAARAANVELDQNKVGRLSRMDALQQQAMQDEILARAKSERPRIKRALLRIERGDYGWCKDCGLAIGDGRLQFNPCIELCIDCANNTDH